MATRGIWIIAVLCSCSGGTGMGGGTGGAGGGTGGAGGGAGACPTPLTVSGAVATSVTNVTFTSATTKVSHAQAEGCLAKAAFTLKAAGCTLELGFTTLEDQWGGLSTVSFKPDKTCPGFSAATAGEYKIDNDTFIPIWFGGPRTASTPSAASACTAATVTFPDRSIPLVRFDGVKLTLNLKGLSLAGDLPSTKDAALACPRLFDSCTPLTHDDGTGICTPVLQCIMGYHDGGGLDCVPNGTCTPGYLLAPNGLDCTIWKESYLSLVALVSLAGSGPNDVWVAGVTSARLVHWDGTAWSEILGPPFFGLYVAGLAVLGPNDAWGVSQIGKIGHWNGTMWVDTPSGTTASFTGVWAAAANDIWAIGAAGTVRRYNGTAWSAATAPSTGNLDAIWGSATTDVWVSGGAQMHHWNGTAWTTTTLDTNSSLKHVWGTGANDVWATANDAVFHWNGTAWTRVLSEPNGFFKAGTSVGPNDVWIAAQNRLLHWDGTAWSQRRSSERTDALWNNGAADIWSAGRRVMRGP